MQIESKLLRLYRKCNFLLVELYMHFNQRIHFPWHPIESIVMSNELVNPTVFLG